MAALTKPLAVGPDWVEVTAGLAMADGSTYAVEVQDVAATGEGHVLAVDTDSNDAPAADARGHLWFPRTAAGDGAYRTFPKKAGRWWWMRSTGPAFFVVATKI